MQYNKLHQFQSLQKIMWSSCSIAQPDFTPFTRRLKWGKLVCVSHRSARAVLTRFSIPTTLSFQACRRVWDVSEKLPHKAKWLPRGFCSVPEPRPEPAATHRDVYGELPSARPHGHHHAAAGPTRPRYRWGARLLTSGFMASCMYPINILHVGVQWCFQCW